MGKANAHGLFISCCCALMAGCLGALGAPWWVAPPLMVAATYFDIRFREKRGIDP